MSTRSRLVRPLALLGAAALTVSLAACAGSDSSADAGSGSSDDLGTLKVGALAVPAGDLLEWVDENLAEEAGLDIE